MRQFINLPNTHLAAGRFLYLAVLVFSDLSISSCRPVMDEMRVRLQAAKEAKLFTISDPNDPNGILATASQSLAGYNRQQVKMIEILYYPLEAQSQIDLDRDSLAKIATFTVLIHPGYPPPSLAEAIRKTHVQIDRDHGGGDLRWRLRIVLIGDHRPIDIYVDNRGESGYVQDVPVRFTSQLPDWLRTATTHLNVPPKSQ